MTLFWGRPLILGAMKTSRTGRVLGACVLAFLSACTGSGSKTFEAPDVGGPPEIQLDVVTQHAESFDEGELKSRPAGSEEEQGAAAYILGILQQNGYFVRLESVPVADLFRSTNVIAQPAAGEDPDAIVVLPYSNSPEIASNGVALGLFLELARAQNVADAQHSVQFVALGAEFAEEEGGSLGSRRLVVLLREEEKDPFVIQLDKITEQGPFQVSGERADEAHDIAEDLGVAPTSPLKDFSLRPDVFGAAGFERMVVSGGAEAVGQVLLEFLASNGT